MSAVVRTEPGTAARPWAAWLVVLATGLVTLAMGVGLGPRHLTEEGLGPAAVGGCLLVAAGVITTVWAVTRILAAVRRRWWAIVVVLVLIATYVVLWTLGQAVAASFAPRPALGDRTPADLGLVYRDVTFTSSDGVDLAGWYLPSRGGAAVALMHGAGSTRSAVLEHAAVLAGHGYGVLLFDARGHGASDGEAMDFGWYGERDASAAVEVLTQQRDDRVTFWLTGLLTDAPEPDSLQRSVSAAAARSDPTRFLLITAGRVPDEGLAADYMRGTHTDAVQTWTVPGAGHAAGLDEEPAEWEERVVTFLDDTLKEVER